MSMHADIDEWRLSERLPAVRHHAARVEHAQERELTVVGQANDASFSVIVCSSTALKPSFSCHSSALVHVSFPVTRQVDVVGVDEHANVIVQQVSDIRIVGFHDVSAERERLVHVKVHNLPVFQCRAHVQSLARLQCIQECSDVSRRDADVRWLHVIDLA